MRHALAGAVAVVACLVITAAANPQRLAMGPGHGLRYCKRPGGPGNYLAASPNVACGTARNVELKVFSRGCVNRTRCLAYGFTCLAYWDGRYDRPFTYTHHATCRAGTRRIEMDEG